MNNPKSMSTKKGVFRFLESPPKLARLAMQEMCLTTCKEFIRNRIGDNGRLSWNTFVGWNFDYCPPPECNSPDMANHSWYQAYGPVSCSIMDWYRFHKTNVFFDCNLRDAILDCIDEFVLTPGGRIDDLATAKNILRSYKFGEVEKFRFSYINCLADDVKNNWCLVSCNPRLRKCPLDSKPLFRFWKSVIRGKLRRLPGDINDSSPLEDRLEVFDKMRWPAIAYFWSHLSKDEQIALAQRIITGEWMKLSFIQHLAHRLSVEQVKQILKEDTIERIRNPIHFLLYYKKLVLEIWNCIKYIIPKRAFLIIVSGLVKHGFDDVEYHSCVDSILLHMWTYAPAHLKSYVLGDFHSHVEPLFRKLNSWTYSEFSLMERHYHDSNCSIRFFVAVLTDLNFQARNELWRKYWTNLIICTVDNCLEEMMKLCWNNEDEIVQFKERHMLNPEEIEKFCVLLIGNGCVSKLEEYFKFCSSDVHLIASVKRNILALPKVQKSFIETVYEKRFLVFDKFINSAYFVDEDARNYKRKLMLSSKKLKDVYAGLDQTQFSISWI